MNSFSLARNRILIHFLLGIALPSGLLGYLAFRGVRNDQALLERERRQELQAMAVELGIRVDQRIAAVEETLVESVRGTPALSSAEIRQRLRFIGSADPIVDASFWVSANGEVRLYADDATAEPVMSGLFEGAGSALQEDASWQRARRIEFQDGDLRTALAAYEELLARTGAEAGRAEVFLAVARVLRKIGDREAAADVYERVAREHGSVPGPGGVPVGLAARLERSLVLLQVGDTAASLGELTAVQRGISSGEWPLRTAQLEFLTGRVMSAFEAALEASGRGLQYTEWNDTLVELRELEGLRRERTSSLDAFRSAASLLEGNTPANAIRTTLTAGGRRFHVALHPSAGGDGRTWGLLLDGDALYRAVLLPSLSARESDAGIAWAIREQDGSLIDASRELPERPPLVSASLQGGFPPWTLELHQPIPGFAQALFTSRRGVYFYSFLLLAGILVFGLTLTARSVNQELRLARMQSDFVSTVSHEFRSPLTAIRQLAEMLKEDRVPSEEKRRRYYEVLLQQSERLSKLVDDVLDFARMEDGRRELVSTPIDPAEFIIDVAVGARQRYAHQGFHILPRTDGPLRPIHADRNALAQALDNLIDNAVKYSTMSREVEVRAFADGGEIVFQVRDFGIGLSAEETGKVFDRFYRGGDPLTRVVKGTGLGLTLVKQIAEAHGGRVEVKSRPNEGSTFSLRLPFDREEGGSSIFV
ncbi:MAG: HAMP domain-containing sensor histidine kinase [Gemmatimonadota bacterium]